jgi:hypothetical protein
VTHLFTVLFFGAVLGSAIAILWSVVDENLEAVLANLPWNARKPPARPVAVVKVSPASRDYWTVPSINSATPIRARTVSPAIAR